MITNQLEECKEKKWGSTKYKKRNLEKQNIEEV